MIPRAARPVITTRVFRDDSFKIAGHIDAADTILLDQHVVSRANPVGPLPQSMAEETMLMTFSMSAVN